MSSETPVIGTRSAPTPIVFTDAAAKKVGQLIEEESNPDLMPPGKKAIQASKTRG